jgi:hypothetical protein
MKGNLKMKWFMPLLIAIVLVASSQLSQAKEPIEFSTEFFKMVEAGKISEAYDQLFSGSQIPAQKPQAVDLLKRQTSSGLPLYGGIVGLEKIREERIGNSIIRLVYVLKLELAPTVWEFYFYKPKENWFLANVIFNDQFQLLHKIE